MLAPVQWLVQALAWLPAALRPGMFVALLVALAWLLIVARGLPRLSRLLCRSVASGVQASIALALHCEALVTGARRARGGAPGHVVLAAGEVAEQIADGALWVHERSAPKKLDRKKRFPWVTMALLVGGFAAAWLVMDSIEPAEETKRQLAAAFEYWRDVEVWAQVDPARRAAPGVPVRDAMVTVSDVRRRGAELSFLVRCGREDGCHDEVDAKSSSGRVLASTSVDIEGHGATLVRLRLSNGRVRRVRVAVYEA
jgi:hypothetical protein